jgi:hypothetical protein
MTLNQDGFSRYFGSSVATSADGRRVIVGEDTGGIWTADLSGGTWSLYSSAVAGADTLQHPKVALSASAGTLVVGTVSGGSEVGVYVPGTAGTWLQDSVLAEPAAPAGGGGGGGGGGGSANLRVTWSAASSLSPVAGAEDDFTITIANTGAAAATQTHLRIILPPTVALLAQPYFEIGTGCSGTQPVDCFLDYIPSGGSTLVRIATRVAAGGTQVLHATVAATSDSDPSDNEATETLQVSVPGTTPVPPASVPPRLRRVSARTLTGARHAASESFDGRFTANEAVTLSLTITPSRSTRKLTLLKASRLIAIVSRRASTALRGSCSHGGIYQFHVRLRASSLAKGETYLVHLSAVNAGGQTATLTIPFAA